MAAVRTTVSTLPSRIAAERRREVAQDHEPVDAGETARGISAATPTHFVAAKDRSGEAAQRD